MLVYRISKSVYANKLRASGLTNRWNTAGNYILYTAFTLSLACLETVVHNSGDLLYKQDYKSITIEVEEDATIAIIDINTLPQNWKERAQKNYTQKIGDDWYSKQETLLLQVPSVIINREWNFLINTKHPDFSKVSIAEVDNFMFDKRIKG